MNLKSAPENPSSLGHSSFLLASSNPAALLFFCYRLKPAAKLFTKYIYYSIKGTQALCPPVFTI